MKEVPEILRQNIIEISITGEELFNNAQDVNLIASMDLRFDTDRRAIYKQKFGINLAKVSDKIYGRDEDIELSYYYNPETGKWEAGEELSIYGLLDPLFYEPTESEDKLIVALIEEAVKELFQCSSEELYQKIAEDNKNQYAESIAEGREHRYYLNRVYTVKQ